MSLANASLLSILASVLCYAQSGRHLRASRRGQRQAAPRSLSFQGLTMATSVDAKLLKQTKFPPEFNQKVDMKKVNVEVMKK